MCSDLPKAHANFPGLVSLQATHASQLMQSYSISPPPQYPPQDGWERMWKTTKCWVCLGLGSTLGSCKEPWTRNSVIWAPMPCLYNLRYTTDFYEPLFSFR